MNHIYVTNCDLHLKVIQRESDKIHQIRKT